MKLLEKILDWRIWKNVDWKISEEQQGFRKGSGAMDGMFRLRHLVEKRLGACGDDGRVGATPSHDRIPAAWISPLSNEARRDSAIGERRKQKESGKPARTDVATTLLSFFL